MPQRVLHRLLRDPENLGVALRIRLEIEIASHVDLGRLHSPQYLDMLA